MKVAGKFDPSKLKCRKTPVTGWCYRIAKTKTKTKAKSKSKVGHVVEYRLMSENGIVMGWMDDGCRMVYAKGKAHVFGSPEAADQTAQKCVLYHRKPVGKDVKAAYKPARGGKLG